VVGSLDEIPPGEAQNRPAGRDQPVLPATVTLEPVRRGVKRPSIQFEDQPEVLEHEVTDTDEAGGVRDPNVGTPSRDSGRLEQPGQSSLGHGPRATRGLVEQPSQSRRASPTG